jgi:Xaa-Pro aminopeptidase
MNMKTARRHLFLSLAALAVLVPALHAQRTGFSRDEFVKRRQALLGSVKEGVVILFGETDAPPPAHFRQDNDFYYFTGCEDANAILVIAAGTGEAFLFLPQQTPREDMVSGPNLLKDPAAKDRLALADIFPLSYFDEYLARNLERTGRILYVRLSPRDLIDEARSEVELMSARRARTHYNDQIPLDNHRVVKLRERYPQCELRDIVPFIDALRVIKSEEEIAVLRRNGRISAQAVREAMLASRPGGFEYEVEAAAVGAVLKGGARGPAYAAIVGSGPNSCIWHYEKNERRIEKGELVLMDFGADLDMMTMDITRTWPASGKFSDEQRDIYRTVLEVQKACIAAFRPGATSKDVRKAVALHMKKKGFDPRGLEGGLGHFVGLSVHDVGPDVDIPLKEGMVMAIEPGLYYSEKGIGIRIEDTVLITRNGCEVLTADVPKEIDEVERLLAGRK